MNKLQLNLGPFNKCIFFLDKEVKAKYSIKDKVNILYYNYHNGDVMSANDMCGNWIVPTFEIGFGSTNFNDNESRTEIIEAIEFNILRMIYKMIDNLGYRPDLNNIKIPVITTEIARDDINSSQYGWVELGIAMFRGIRVSCVR